MTTLIISVSSSALNAGTSTFGQQTDAGAPSFYDMHVTGSTNPLIPNGVYDAYCIDPTLGIRVEPRTFNADSIEASTNGSFQQIKPTDVNYNALTQVQVDKLNWLLSQNFTSDPKYAGKYNYGEVQTAIWRILGFSQATIDSEGFGRFLSDNNRNTVASADIDFLLSAANNAVTIGHYVSPPPGTNFSMLIDPSPLTGTETAPGIQPLIVQLKNAKLGDFVWLDSNANGIQDTGEAGVDNLVVELWKDGIKIASTTTGDDFSTIAVEHGFYQFAGLGAGDYQVKFVAPDYQFTAQDANSNTQDAKDSDANVATGFSQIVSLNAGESNQTIDAGLLLAGAISGFVYCDDDNDGVKDAGEVGLGGVPVRLQGTNDLGQAVDITINTDADGSYSFTGLRPGTYSVTETTQPDGKLDGKDTAGSLGGNTTVNEVISGIVLGAGQSSVNNNFGEIKAVAAIDIEKYVQGVYTTPGDGAAEGLTPGFWKTHSAAGPAPLAGWPETGRSPSDSYEAVFGVNVPGTPSLLDALNTGGGGLNALLRHSTAALLNASNPYVNYEYTVAEVIQMTKTAINTANYESTKDLFATQNELGADLSDLASAGVTVTTAVFDADTVGSGPVIPTGGTALFTYEVKNTGNTELANVVVSDDRLGTPIYVGGDADNDGKLDLNETWTYKASELVSGTGNKVNIGTATGTNAFGQSATDNDAANYSTNGLIASLGDRVWVDTNGNGQQDDGATGFNGLTVTLIGGGADGLINSIGDTTQTTVTAGDGNYLFTNLTAGTQYQVMFSKPGGYNFTTANLGNDGSDSDAIAATGKSQIVTLTAGEINLSIDAGLVQTATIGNRVWLDCDADGIQDNGELGVANVTVKLLDGSGVEIASQVTNANGEYQFTGLNPGQYAVQFTPLAGYNFTTKDAGNNDALDSDADIVTGKTITTTLTSGEVDLSWDAGLTPVCRPVTFDFSGNSSTDGTDGNSRSYTDTLTGVSVTARAFSQDKGTNTWQKAFLGAYGGGLGVTDTSEGTGSGNTHTVDNIGRNNYIVLQFSQDVLVDKAFLGYVSGDSDAQIWVGNAASAITTMSNSVLNGASLTEVNTTTLTTARWADFNATGVRGNLFIIAADTTDTTPEDYFKLEKVSICAPDYCAPVAKASIGNYVWEDKDYDGVQDAGEKGINNVTVNLLSSAGAVLATTTTDINGAYAFTNLNPGDYKVQVVTPSGYFTTKKDIGGNTLTSDALDSDIDSTGTTVLTTLTAGENDTSWDAGFYRKASVGDKVWEDRNHNWIQDGNDPGIGGVKVALMDATGTTVLATTTTNTSGNYSFVDLDPGTYVLRFDKGNVIYNGYNMNNWMWGVKDVGSNDAVDSDVAGDGIAKTNVTKTDAFTLMSGQADLTRDAAITPIVIDLDGNGIQTVSRANSGGTFDLFGNGAGIHSGWISGGDGFLAVDKNGNGQVDSINELFGGNTKGAGFANLAAYDSNHDGVVDNNDANFADLLIWRDANGNHATDAGELSSLAQSGIASLAVGYTEVPFLDAQGNLHLERSTATLADGSSVDMTDVYFNVSADDAAAAGVELPTIGELLANDSSLDGLLAGLGVAPAASADVACDKAFDTGAADAMKQMAQLYDQTALAA